MLLLMLSLVTLFGVAAAIDDASAVVVDSLGSTSAAAVLVACVARFTAVAAEPCCTKLCDGVQMRGLRAVRS